MNVAKLFDFRTGSLPSLERTEDGDIPLVYGGASNNGIAKFVKVQDEKQIFKPPKITVSYLGTAFVQVVPFTTSVVDKSNIIVLDPKKEMSLEEMYFHAFQINRIAKFGYYYSRRMNMRQLSKLNLLPFHGAKKIEFKRLLPRVKRPTKIDLTHRNIDTSLTELFDVTKAKSKGFDHYSRGDVPFVSNGFANNGIVGFVDPEPTDRVFNQDAICISAFCEATVQRGRFMPRGNGGSGLSVLIPKHSLGLQELLFHAAYINRAYGWRFSYGRMVTHERLLEMQLRTTPPSS